MVYPVNMLVGAVEWGFLFRRYQVWNNYSQETVELNPFEVWNSYVYKYLLAFVIGFIAYGLGQALIMRFVSFRGSWQAKRGITELEESELSIGRDVKSERQSAMRASARQGLDMIDEMDLSSEHGDPFIEIAERPPYALIVSKLQCWKTLSKKDIGPHNQHSVI